MQLNDRIIGLLALCGGIAIAYGTLDFRELPGQAYGSAFFPRILSACFFLVGLVFIFKPSHVTNEATPPEKTAVDWLSLFRQLSIPLAGVLWIMLVEKLGFIATTFLMLFALMQIARGKPAASFFVAMGLTIMQYLVFGKLLHVPLPIGLVEQVLR